MKRSSSFSFRSKEEQTLYQNKIESDRTLWLTGILILRGLSELFDFSSSAASKNDGWEDGGRGFQILSAVTMLLNCINLLLIKIKTIKYFGSSSLLIIVEVGRVILINLFESMDSPLSDKLNGFQTVLAVIIIIYLCSYLWMKIMCILILTLVAFLTESERDAISIISTLFIFITIMAHIIFLEHQSISSFKQSQYLNAYIQAIDTLVPSSVILAKFNPREEIIELNQINQAAKNKFKVTDSLSLNNFLSHIFLDKIPQIRQSFPPNNLKTKIRNMIDFMRKSPTSSPARSPNLFKNLILSHSEIPMFPLHFQSQRSIKGGRDSCLSQISSPIKNKISSPTKFSNFHYKNVLTLHHANSTPQQLSSENSISLSGVQKFSERRQARRNRYETQTNVFQKSNNSRGSYFRRDDNFVEENLEVKVWNYLLDEVYVIIVLEEEDDAGKLLRERHRQRTFEQDCRKFQNQIGFMVRSLFYQLRLQQISLLKEQIEHKDSIKIKECINSLKSSNILALGQTFSVINYIDNFMLAHDSLSNSFLSENDLKTISLKTILENLFEVISPKHKNRQIRSIVYFQSVELQSLRNDENNNNNLLLKSSPKHLSQLLYNILNLSYQLCCSQGVIQVIIEKSLSQVECLEISIRHTIKDESFSIFSLNEQQQISFETSKKILQLISPYSKFFIKQRIQLYAQIKFFLYEDLTQINSIVRQRRSLHSRSNNEQDHNLLVEEEECAKSEDLSILETVNPLINEVKINYQSKIKNQDILFTPTLQETTTAASALNQPTIPDKSEYSESRLSSNEDQEDEGEGGGKESYKKITSVEKIQNQFLKINSSRPSVRWNQNLQRSSFRLQAMSSQSNEIFYQGEELVDIEQLPWMRLQSSNSFQKNVSNVIKSIGDIPQKRRSRRSIKSQDRNSQKVINSSFHLISSSNSSSKQINQSKNTNVSNLKISKREIDHVNEDENDDDEFHNKNKESINKQRISKQSTRNSPILSPNPILNPFFSSISSQNEQIEENNKEIEQSPTSSQDERTPWERKPRRKVHKEKIRDEIKEYS